MMIVDDEKEIRELFRDVLESRGYEVLTCDSGYAALQVVNGRSVFAAFVDNRMPGMDGVETLKALKAAAPDMPVVMITGYARDEAVEDALRSGCFVCMMKPFNLRDVLSILDIIEVGGR